MVSWWDGYAIFTGNIDNISNLITKRFIYEGKHVPTKVEENKIVFPEDFIPWDLLLLDAVWAFIGFEQNHDIKKTDTPGIYEVSVSWDQVGFLPAEKLSTIAKRNNLAIEAEGIILDWEFKQHIIVNNCGEILLNECIEYHREDYDPYDDYKKIK
ncbi:hypothetical protein FITA111629_14170 [Filibacter tadaridae]|uniref:Uncharacterized protein n=2 Tax=Filibacter tadaridae TaxID=2483811 RepID=A0A3P5X6R1_9BACL|nr:hypothetical protein [Filibacter tadaridae]VDC23997.1 hypothetical protein FILTAD_00962 [Filibacter tadaridae]